MINPEAISYSSRLSESISLLFQNCLEKESRYTAKFGITVVEIRCINILHELGTLSVNQLAKQLSVTSSRVTRLSDGLIKKGLVIRQTSENDRRIYLLSLTKKGLKLACKAAEHHKSIHKEILNQILYIYFAVKTFILLAKCQ